MGAGREEGLAHRPAAVGVAGPLGTEMLLQNAPSMLRWVNPLNDLGMRFCPACARFYGMGINSLNPEGR